MKKSALCINLLVIARPLLTTKKLIIDNSPYINDKDMKFYTLIVGITFYKLNILFFPQWWNFVMTSSKMEKNADIFNNMGKILQNC